MARPTKHRDEQRSATARARVTESEHEHIKQQAHLAGLDVSEFIRRRLLGYEVPSAATRRADPGLVTELNRLGLALKEHSFQVKALGKNANQLALASHTSRRSQIAWEGVVNEVERLGKRSDEQLDLIAATLEKVVLSDS